MESNVSLCGSEVTTEVITAGSGGGTCPSAL